VNFFERVMRVMTHINIGASLGIAAWVLWSGWLLVTGQISPAYRVAEVKALMSTAHAGKSPAMHLVPVQASADAVPPCHAAMPASQRAAVAVSEADL
jgi:hypothetical protein